MNEDKLNNQIPTVVRAFQNGEEWAFSEIYNRYWKPILKHVSQRIRDIETAKDITQEVFLKVYRFRSLYRSEHAFSTWLWTIARNTITDSLKKVHIGETPDNTTDDLPCLKANAEALLQRKSDRKMLVKLLGNLTRLQRKVIWMSVIYQLPYQEIAKRLDLSVSAVKCLAYRSRQAILQLHQPAL